MSSPYKIYLTGADDYRWALYEDQQQTKASISDFVDFVPVSDANIIHSVYWESLKSIPDDVLSKRTVICNLSGEWSRYENDHAEPFLKVADIVDVWVVRSRGAEKVLKDRGLNSFYIPYTVNVKTFYPLHEHERLKFRKKLGIAPTAYVMGNFMRDSTAGKICQPKLVKGPDRFVAIAKALCERNIPVHVLLAGPRRHWIRQQLKKEKIPFTFYGYKLWFDDMRINTLSRAKLNRLYNVLDLSLVSSRSEAGPHAILEAAAACRPQLSSRVGIAEDVLHDDQLFSGNDEAVEKIAHDFLTRNLSQFCREGYQTIQNHHTAHAASMMYKALYAHALKEK